MLFSILIPVYNVERYLEQCLESVLNQDFRDFEVILVNDGSTDSSGSICMKYARGDTRVKYFEKKNEGLLQTRRYSIKRASGEYILFLDSDDFWEPGVLSAIREDRGIFPDRTVFTAESKEIFLKELVSSSRLNMLWTKCVRKTIIDVETDYTRFGDKKGEDLLQSVPLIRNAASILYLDDVFVNYRMSSSGRGRNFKLRHLDDYEVILVDDGSKDSSPSICRKYEQRDPRIKYFEKRNEGLLQTRRYSIKRASGEYILFLDSDDFWEPGVLSATYI